MNKNQRFLTQSRIRYAPTLSFTTHDRITKYIFCFHKYYDRARGNIYIVQFQIEHLILKTPQKYCDKHQITVVFKTKRFILNFK